MRVNGRRVCVLLIGGLVSGLLMSLVRDDEIIRPLQGQDFSVTGQWSAPQPWPVTAVHDHMLPTGKVLFYGYSDEAWLWDPQTDGLTPAAHVGYNIFCTGHSWMADGRLLVSGGHIANNVGLPNAAIYDPYIDSWTKLPNMNAGRWYPTNTTLPNGDVL